MIVELLVQFFDGDGRPRGQPEPVIVCRSLWTREEDVTIEETRVKASGKCFPAQWESQEGDRYPPDIYCGAWAGTIYAAGSTAFRRTGLWYSASRLHPPYAWVTCRIKTEDLIG